mmetsp:Transcript_6951/g.15628  ORF Transcript_6951/g.15628 Transcript_6951/m.15628 type:complete len:201 (-) Transcript_6951:57-659(-)
MPRPTSTPTCRHRHPSPCSSSSASLSATASARRPPHHHRRRCRCSTRALTGSRHRLPPARPHSPPRPRRHRRPHRRRPRRPPPPAQSHPPPAQSAHRRDGRHRPCRARRYRTHLCRVWRPAPPQGQRRRGPPRERCAAAPCARASTPSSHLGSFLSPPHAHAPPRRSRRLARPAAARFAAASSLPTLVACGGRRRGHPTG